MKDKLLIFINIFIFMMGVTFKLYAVELPNANTPVREIVEYVESCASKPAAVSSAVWNTCYDKVKEYVADPSNFSNPNQKPTLEECLKVMDTLNQWKSSDTSQPTISAEDAKKQTGSDINNTIAKNNNNKSVQSTGEQRSAVDFDDVISDTSKYKPDENAMDANSAKKIEGATSKILTTISNVGIVVAVIMLAIIGIKYMIGSVEEKAQYKEDMLPYVIGAFILFSITGLVKILIAIGNKIN